MPAGVIALTAADEGPGDEQKALKVPLRGPGGTEKGRRDVEVPLQLVAQSASVSPMMRTRGRHSRPRAPRLVLPRWAYSSHGGRRVRGVIRQWPPSPLAGRGAQRPLYRVWWSWAVLGSVLVLVVSVTVIATSALRRRNRYKRQELLLQSWVTSVSRRQRRDGRRPLRRRSGTRRRRRVDGQDQRRHRVLAMAARAAFPSETTPGSPIPVVSPISPRPRVHTRRSPPIISTKGTGGLRWTPPPT
jgi:hypothetical protein